MSGESMSTSAVGYKPSTPVKPGAKKEHFVEGEIVLAKGQTLTDVSKKTGRSVMDICLYSGISDPNRVKEGQHVFIPDIDFSHTKAVKEPVVKPVAKAAGQKLSPELSKRQEFAQNALGDDFEITTKSNGDMYIKGVYKSDKSHVEIDGRLSSIKENLGLKDGVIAERNPGLTKLDNDNFYRDNNEGLDDIMLKEGGTMFIKASDIGQKVNFRQLLYGTFKELESQ